MSNGLPKHGQGDRSLGGTAAQVLRDLAGSDGLLLAALLVGVLLWPWFGFLAALTYTVLVVLVAVTVWLVRRSRRG